MTFVEGAAERPANDPEKRRPEIATHRLESVVSKNTASRIPFLIMVIRAIFYLSPVTFTGGWAFFVFLFCVVRLTNEDFEMSELELYEELVEATGESEQFLRKQGFSLLEPNVVEERDEPLVVDWDSVDARRGS